MNITKKVATTSSDRKLMAKIGPSSFLLSESAGNSIFDFSTLKGYFCGRYIPVDAVLSMVVADISIVVLECSAIFEGKRETM